MNGKGPDWLVLDRVLGAFELAKDGRGRRAYVAWLEARADAGGEVGHSAMGHTAGVSRLLGACQLDERNLEALAKLEKMLR